jgi:hypothetical protein
VLDQRLSDIVALAEGQLSRIEVVCGMARTQKLIATTSIN